MGCGRTKDNSDQPVKINQKAPPPTAAPAD